MKYCKLTKEEVEHNYCDTEDCKNTGCKICEKLLKKYQKYLKEVKNG